MVETAHGRGAVHLVFAGPQAGGRQVVLQFRLVDANRARLTYAAIPGEPHPLIRVAPDTPLGPFDPARIYDRDDAVTETGFPSADEQSEPTAASVPLEVANALDALAEVDGGEEEETDRPPMEADFLDGL